MLFYFILLDQIQSTDAALDCKKKGESKTILFNLCGHGHFDMTAYDDYFSGKLEDDFYDEVNVNNSLSSLLVV